jgi:hypothetical protein
MFDCFIDLVGRLGHWGYLVIFGISEDILTGDSLTIMDRHVATFLHTRTTPWLTGAMLLSRHRIRGIPGNPISRRRIQERIEAIFRSTNCFEPLSVATKFGAQTANMGVYCPCQYRILILQNV